MAGPLTEGRQRMTRENGQMKARRVFSYCGATALIAASIALPARAAALLDAPVSFSAMRTVTIDGKTYNGPMYHVPGHERDEQKIGAMNFAFILDDPAAQGFLVVPSVKTYVVFPFPPLLSAMVDGDLRKNPVGTAMVDRIPTTEYRVAGTISDGTHGEGFVWLSKRGVLMRLKGTVTSPGGHKTRIAMHLADVKEGPQKPALFARPMGMTALPFKALAPLLGGALGLGHALR